ncbi:uncharacterized protein L199_004289 [Kwoniella botswanensis]|uniref:uncharacterized protein n=1 Tax=Kwoniella botswanensis TaxID=1268659 RepID=UPI00315CCBED
MSQEVHGLSTPPLLPIDPTGRVKDYGYSPVGIEIPKDPRKSIDNGHGQGQGISSKPTYSPSIAKPITPSIVENQNQQEIATPSLASNSTISELSINQLGLSQPASSSIYTESEGVKSNDDTPVPMKKIGTGVETTLDSLAKLRQFKAEVEATRQHPTLNAQLANKDGRSVGMGEMNPSLLAKMAESFILQQQQKLGIAGEGKGANTDASTGTTDKGDYSPLNVLEGSGNTKERESELRERLLSSRSRPNENQSRKRNNESNSPFIEHGYGYEENKRPRNDIQLPTNPPWNERNDRGRSTSTIRSDNYDDTNKYSRFPPPHPNDQRFTRRDQSAGTTSSGPDYKPSETNFVPSRYQTPPERERDRRHSQEGRGRPRTPPPPPIRNEPRRDSVNRSFGGKREGHGYGNGNESQRLADRISGAGPSPAPKYRPRSPSPARNYSNHRREQEYQRGPTRPRHYPDPRTPVDPTYGRRSDIPNIDPYGSYAIARGQPLGHARPPSPGYGRPPPPPARDQRYGYDPEGREDAYLRAPPPPPGYHDRYDRPPPPPPPPIGGNVFAQGQGIDTNNVVETLEALKAQISKLEKLVPTANTNVNTQPPPPPPPPPHSQGYDPYTGYDYPREPHPRERDYNPRPFPPPGGSVYQARGRFPSPPPPPPHRYEGDHRPGHEHEYDDRPGPGNDRGAGHGHGPGYGRGRGHGHGHGHGGGGRGRGGGKRGRGGRGGRGGR